MGVRAGVRLGAGRLAQAWRSLLHARFLPLGEGVLWEAVALKWGLFHDQNLLSGEKKFLLPEEYQAGGGAKRSQDPHFQQQ